MTKIHAEQIDLTSLVSVLTDAGIVVTTPAFALVIETGSGVSNANSYVSLAEATAYAAQRGVNLGADGTALATLLVKAADWLDGKEGAFQGERATATQALAWPRDGVCLYNDDLVATAVPNRVKHAQIELVIALVQGVEIALNSDVSVKREKLRELDTEYFSPQASARLPRVDSLLQPLYKSRGFAGLLVTR